MYNKYKRVTLSPDQIQMFADIIGQDEVTQKIFLFIGTKMARLEEIENSSNRIGATINDMSIEIQINRSVKIKGKSKYKVAKAPLDRKRAERIVQQLLMTGLIYFELVGKTKVLFLTDRGIVVLKELVQRGDLFSSIESSEE